LIPAIAPLPSLGQALIVLGDAQYSRLHHEVVYAIGEGAHLFGAALPMDGIIV
jgi:hypothetical protein